MNEDSLRKALAGRAKMRNRGGEAILPLFEWHEELGSTNTRADALGRQEAPSGTLVTAERQTAGRGRRGRVWESPAGANIAMSLLLRPQVPTEQLPQLTVLCALAVARALRELGAEPAIKWPNDIYLGGRKLCGILCETAFEKGKVLHTVAGIGINVKKAPKPPEVAALSVSLEEAGFSCERESLIAAVCDELLGLIGQWERCGSLSFIRTEYEEAMLWLGEEARILTADGGALPGVIRGITAEGGLRFDTARGSEVITAGEVSLRRAP